MSEAGENAKFLMTIASLVTVCCPAGDTVADALADEELLKLLELLELLEQAVSTKTMTSPGTHSQL